MRAILFLSLFVFSILGCQTSATNMPTEETPVLVETMPGNKIRELSNAERQELRRLLDVFYDGDASAWAQARAKILSMGPVGVESLSIFMLKFFFGGKENIPLESKYQDVAEYWNQARAELANLKGQAVPYIIAVMAHPKIGSTGRAQCSLTLSEIGVPAVAPLVANLNRGDYKFQRAVLETLGNIQSSDATQAISAYYLRMPKPSSKVSNIEDDPTVDLRYYAIKALGKIRDPEGLMALEKALTDPNDLVVQQALESLLKIDDTSAIPVLEKALLICKEEFLGYRGKVERKIQILSRL